jgi:hypothetical protein
MPSPTTVEYLDGEFEINEQEPSSVAELVELLGEDAVRQETISNLRYRNKHPRVYRKVSALVESSFAREVKESKTNADGTVKEIKISPIDHLRAYLASGDTAKADLAEKFNAVANEEPLFVKGERAGGSGKISKDALDNANKYFAVGDDAVEACASAIEANVPGYKVGRDADGAATPESLARGIQALGKYVQQQAQKAALGSLPKF